MTLVEITCTRNVYVPAGGATKGTSSTIVCSSRFLTTMGLAAIRELGVPSGLIPSM